MNRAKVVVYTTGYCPYCVAAKRLLQSRSVPFDEVDCDDRPDLRTWLKQATRQHTVPQIFINGESVGGFTELAALQKSGALDEKLAAEPPAGAEPLPA
ncbi:MAG: glutaredoxin [Polyangiaceae bacterium]|nr:glutaredoxin [Polyangiaceae bacterium]